jgi:hypothetical protein
MQIRIITLAIIVFLLFQNSPCFCQGTHESFGKNRVQYYSFEWSSLSTNSVDLYFYPGGESLAKTACELAEVEFKRISDLFGFTPYHKIKIFLYLSTNDRLMSNVGLSELANQTGGKTNFTKSTTEIAYEGSLQNLKKQISAGIAQILIRDMLFGGSLKDAVQNSFLLTLPDWFIGGAIKYASEGSGSDMNDLLQTITSKKRFRLPSNYVGKESFLVGQSIWNFIGEKYGRSTIGNILNLTRITRNEENSISGTLGMPFKVFLRDWKNYYQSRANQDIMFFEKPNLVNKVGTNFYKRNYRQLVFSSDGEYLVYSQDLKGKFLVVSYHLKTKKSHVIFRGGSKALFQNAEGEFPVLCLSQEGRIYLAFPNKGKWDGLSMSLTGSQRKRIPVFREFHEIYSMQISADGNHIVFSGSKDGFSDIFLLKLKGLKVTRHTNDWFDDLDPFFNQNGDSIYFSSNRPGSDSIAKSGKSLPDLNQKLNIYKLPVVNLVDPQLVIKSKGNLTKGRFLKSRDIVCLSDQFTASNVVVFDKNSGFSESGFLTSSKYSIKDYSILEDFKSLSYSIQYQMRPSLFVDLNFEASILHPLESPSGNLKGSFAGSQEFNSPGKPLLDSTRINIRRYVFEDEKKESDDLILSGGGSAKIKRERIKLKKEIKPWLVEIKGPEVYTPQITANHITTGIIIDPIPSWGLGALVDFSLNDLFENHQFSGGMNYFFSDVELRNNFSMLEYQYLKNRVDFKMRVERKSIQNSSAIQQVRQRDVLFNFFGTISFPFSNTFRFEVSPYFQTTKRILFDRSVGQLGGPEKNINYFGLAGQFVFDNTTKLGTNMMAGTCFKVRSQYQVANKYQDKSFGEFFVDFRTYQPIHNEITLAFRSTMGNFFGRAPKKYSLGGMDNWLFRSYDVSNEKDDPLRGLNQNNLAVSSEQAQTDWLFNRFCTNLRGFNYNAAYGTSFLLFNLELRVPIIQYIYKGPIDSDFWRHLQITAFSDIGTSWTGVGPFSKNNSFNSVEINEGNFTIKVKSYESPFLTGYGLGLRSLFLGYYSKLDVAWGTRNGSTSRPNYYLTLGHDF